MSENELREVRLEKLKILKEAGINPYTNGITPKHFSKNLIEKYDALPKEKIESLKENFSLAGRVIAVRSFGKAGFLIIRDRTGEFQLFTQRGKVGEEGDLVLKTLDVGDIVFAEGPLFRTKTDQLTLKVECLRHITKSIETLPEKYHGLTDVEARYRRRYVDLIANPEVKETFKKRSQIVSEIRKFFEAQDFLEVETPMMQAIPGGAKAKPFRTHHNALNRDLYLRVAPELYLKRLLVGGMERVFELNRNFRNEGISTQHNPEFTMLEFYMAYATYEDLIVLTEDLLHHLAKTVCGKEGVTYQGQEISFSKPFERVTLLEAIEKNVRLSKKDLQDRKKLIEFCRDKKLKIKAPENTDLGILQLVIFEEFVEKHLIQPTFVTEFPIAASPLSRRNDKRPEIADRFEFFINGREIANAFSELNDPFDQKDRFLKQVQERENGDEEAMFLDEDYVKALEFGMPPAAGEGIGIDRLVMLLTDSPSIRDVILFPTLRSL